MIRKLAACVSLAGAVRCERPVRVRYGSKSVAAMAEKPVMGLPARVIDDRSDTLVIVRADEPEIFEFARNQRAGERFPAIVVRAHGLVGIESGRLAEARRSFT